MTNRRLTILLLASAAVALVVSVGSAQQGPSTLSSYVSSSGVARGTIQALGDVIAASTGAFSWLSSSSLKAPSDGVVTLLNNAGTDFTRLQFGGTTSSFPAIKRSNADFLLRLADDSGYTRVIGSIFAPINSQITAASGTGIVVNISGNLVRVVYEVTVNSSACIVAAVTCDITIGTLPAKTALLAVYADLTTVFACASVCTTATLSLTAGSTAGGTDLLVSFDADAAIGTFGLTDGQLGTALNRATAVQGGKIYSFSATQALSLRLTSGTGNIGTGAATNLSQGSVVFYIVTERFP